MIRSVFFLICFLLIPFAQAQQDVKAIKVGEKYAKKAEKALKKDQLEKALPYYSQAINTNPNKEEYYLQRGRIYKKLGKEEAAIRDFTNAIEFQPKTSSCYIERSYCFLNLKDYQHALDDANMHAKIKGETNEIWSIQSSALMHLGDYQGAITCLTKTIENKGNNAESYIDRARCYIETSNYKLAASDLKQAEELGYADYYEFNNIKGLYYLRIGEPRKSINYYERILNGSRRSLFNSDSFWYFSNAYHALGILDSAIIQVNKAIAHKEKPEYFLDRANYYSELGQLENAAKDFAYTIELDSTLTGAYNNRTFYIWFPQKKFQNAVDDLTKVITIDPDNAYAYSNRSYAYLGLNDLEHAFIDAFKSVELENRNPYVYKNLALMYYAINDLEEATNAAKGALHYQYPIETDPEFSELLKILGL